MTKSLRAGFPPKNCLAAEDLDFLKAFECCNMENYNFNHEAHVRLAWIYVRQYPLTQAIALFCDGLKRLTAATGSEGKYHETISWLYLLVIAERDARQHHDTFAGFRVDNPDLLAGGGAFLERYYAAEDLKDPFARRHFVLPGRAA